MQTKTEKNEKERLLRNAQMWSPIAFCEGGRKVARYYISFEMATYPIETLMYGIKGVRTPFICSINVINQLDSFQNNAF